MTGTAYVAIQSVVQALPPMGALADTFGGSSLDTSKWATVHYNMGGSSVAETGGSLEFTLGGAEGDIGVISVQPYDLTGSYAIVELNDVGRAADVDGSGFGLMLQVSPGDVYSWVPSLQWWVQAGTLWAAWETIGVQNEIGSQAYDSVNHKWLRLRESGGTTYFDTSADASTWVNQYSIADPIPVTSLYATLISLQWDTSGTTSASLSNFNSPAGYVPSVTASAVVFSSDGTVVDELTVAASFSAGDTNETIREAIVGAVQAAAGDDTLTVEFVTG